jgi:hypothetical protein
VIEVYWQFEAKNKPSSNQQEVGSKQSCALYFLDSLFNPEVNIGELLWDYIVSSQKIVLFIVTAENFKSNIIIHLITLSFVTLLSKLLTVLLILLRMWFQLSERGHLDAPLPASPPITPFATCTCICAVCK